MQAAATTRRTLDSVHVVEIAEHNHARHQMGERILQMPHSYVVIKFL